MNNVIQVENVSKQYRLGEVGTGTLAHDINRWWYKVRGKEDPYLQIGEKNDRTSRGVSEYIWALQNVNFNVGAGEVVGIIGKNGAGKSTLLKLLSRTTAPTIGSIKMKGRIASLLEVGTGFHPELSGRDNIFLNGAILGMSKLEVKQNFDEIVEFAGVERYVDTPVKRYSSGMYVRLAFAVAAHLRPDILIVDEVLAVGDAEFQKKALGKLKAVSSGHGRTILFVSHSMGAISSICDRGIVMEQGTIAFDGRVEKAVEIYNQSNTSSDIPVINSGVATSLNLISKNKDFKIQEISVLDDSGSPLSMIQPGQNFKIVVKLFCTEDIDNGAVDIQIQNHNNENLIYLSNNPDAGIPLKFKIGSNRIECSVLNFPLNAGTYRVNLALAIPNIKWLIEPTYVGDLEVLPPKVVASLATTNTSRAYCYIKSDWKIEQPVGNVI